jgi:hypothetical protein
MHISSSIQHFIQPSSYHHCFILTIKYKVLILTTFTKINSASSISITWIKSPHVLNLSDFHYSVQMAALVVAVGVGIVLAAEKIHDHKEKKRNLKNLQHGLVEEISIVEDTATHHNMDDLPAYQAEKPPPYHMAEQHPAFRPKKKSVDSSRW